MPEILQLVQSLHFGQSGPTCGCREEHGAQPKPSSRRAEMVWLWENSHPRATSDQLANDPHGPPKDLDDLTFLSKWAAHCSYQSVGPMPGLPTDTLYITRNTLGCLTKVGSTKDSIQKQHS